jgi:rare lipoprotein A (peptidoglycan hydrolase)
MLRLLAVACLALAAWGAVSPAEARRDRPPGVVCADPGALRACRTAGADTPTVYSAGRRPARPGRALFLSGRDVGASAGRASGRASLAARRRPAVWHAAAGEGFAGIASFYGRDQGPATASGERFNENDMTAAHRSLAFGTRLRVTWRGRSVVVRINDRGPFIAGRVLDLSKGAARALGLIGAGVGHVTAEVL